MNGLTHLEEPDDYTEFVEVDPTGRYGRYNEILGRGASKTVYRGFDEYEGIEVAWNQVKLYDFLQSPEDLERLYCEIHLLKTLKHKNIMKFYTSWVDTANRNMNFVTEMFTSGTLRQYRVKHKRVNIRAVKHWCRQILSGLLYLHSHDPPVIHRDLKCDNIFVNGNQGEVKIGDLGLAAILRKSHAAHCVGTPEFMAPEVYEEAYNELVDIYSFGMCILEMVTFEYPYSECTNPAQIYKKVISGKKPDALYKVKDPDVRQFVEKCLATVSLRLSARELLNDPFLCVDNCESNLRPLDYMSELDDMGPRLRQPFLEFHHSNSSFTNGYSNGYAYESQTEWGYQPTEIECNGIKLFEYQEDDHSPNFDISIRGKKRDDGGIFLRLRIADKEGRVRNIYFPFDIETDTALSVATEMVAELDITDQDVTKIADMIDGEIASLVPEWRSGPWIEESPCSANQNYCQNCASNRTSNGSLMDFLSNNPGARNLELLQCCGHGCAASMRGRFEEITFEVNESENGTKIAQNPLSQSDCLPCVEIWNQHESRELSPVHSGRSHSDEEYDKLNHLTSVKDVGEMKVENEIASGATKSVHSLTGSQSIYNVPSLINHLSDGYENEIQQELRWLKAKYQMELRKLKDQQLRLQVSESSGFSNGGQKTSNGFISSSGSNPSQGSANRNFIVSLSCDKNVNANTPAYVKKSFPNSESQRPRNCAAMKGVPNPLHRTTSLPVDAVDV